jgi:DNA repair protein RadC
MNTLTENEQKTINRALKIMEKKAAVYGGTFSNPSYAKDFFKLKLRLEERECFACLFLNNQHQMIDCEVLFQGTIDSASVYPREVAKRALHHNAAAVIFAHNHPSGVAEPSQADRMITEKLQQVLQLFDIRVLDHFIIGSDVYSFAEHGLI